MIVDQVYRAHLDGDTATRDALLAAHLPPPLPNRVPTLTPFLTPFDAQHIHIITPHRQYHYTEGQQVITAVLSGRSRRRIKRDVARGYITLQEPQP